MLINQDFKYRNRLEALSLFLRKARQARRPSWLEAVAQQADEKSEQNKQESTQPFTTKIRENRKPECKNVPLPLKQCRIIITALPKYTFLRDFMSGV